MTMQNPMCDGGHCASEGGEVRVLPTGRRSNGIRCRHCYEREMEWRRQENRRLGEWAKHDLPAWESLKAYVSS
jgi:hypothetical protein